MNLAAVTAHQFYAFLLVFARVAGLIVTAPLLSNRSVPRTARAGFAVVFSLAILPYASTKCGPIPGHVLVLVAAVLKDALFGMTVGYFARILFSAVEMAGFFIDTQMGFGFMNLVDPFSEQQASILSTFEYQLAITIYLLAGGHRALLGAVADSFSLVPPGAISAHASAGLLFVPVLKTMFLLGFRLCLPAAGVLVTVDFAFGLVARMAPQVNVFMVGQPAKIIVGLTTVALSLPVLALMVGQITGGTVGAVHALARGLR